MWPKNIYGKVEITSQGEHYKNVSKNEFRSDMSTLNWLKRKIPQRSICGLLQEIYIKVHYFMQRESYWNYKVLLWQKGKNNPQLYSSSSQGNCTHLKINLSLSEEGFKCLKTSGHYLRLPECSGQEDTNVGCITLGQNNISETLLLEHF